MKMKAFTILESIITLALISIIISMVYLVIVYFSKSVSDYTKISAENFELNLFSLKLKEDFYNSESVTSMNGNDFTVDFYDDSRVDYYHKNNYLFRETPINIDSIKIKNMQLQYLFDDSAMEYSNLVESLSIETDQYKNTIKLYVYKTYFSNYLNTKK